MTIGVFVSTFQPILKNDGSINANGVLHFYEPGESGSTYKIVYSDKDLTSSAGSQVTLDSGAQAVVYLNGDYDLIVKDSTGATVRTRSNINPDQTTTTSDINLISNGSFETVANNLPSSWTLFEWNSGANVVDNSAGNFADGEYSMKFVSTGSGGGTLTTNSFFTVNESTNVRVEFLIKSSDANVRNIVQVLWYDEDQAALGTPSTSVFDAASATAGNSTSWVKKSVRAVPPSGARFAKLKLIGCDSSDATSGTTWYDGVITHLEELSLNLTSILDQDGHTTFANGLGPNYLNNCRITASVGSNAITIALKGNDGNDPSATNPVEIAFRHATATDGSFVVRQITTALSMTVDAGAKLGFTSVSQTGDIYVYAIDNAGTVVLGCSGIGHYTGFDEFSLASSTLLDTSADSGVTLYSDAAQTSKAVRYLGRLTIQADGSTIGNWSNSPTVIGGTQKESVKYIQQTAVQTTTSGTSKTFSDIPPWTKKVTITFEDLSTNGVGSIRIQFGTGGTATTSGYKGSVVELTNAAAIVAAALGAGFSIDPAGAAGTIRHGVFTAVLEDSTNHIWSAKWSSGSEGGTLTIGAGSIQLAGKLDMFLLQNSAGDTFDGGSISAIYEG